MNWWRHRQQQECGGKNWCHCIAKSICGKYHKKRQAKSFWWWLIYLLAFRIFQRHSHTPTQKSWYITIHMYKVGRQLLDSFLLLNFTEQFSLKFLPLRTPFIRFMVWQPVKSTHKPKHMFDELFSNYMSTMKLFSFIKNFAMCYLLWLTLVILLERELVFNSNQTIISASFRCFFSCLFYSPFN